MPIKRYEDRCRASRNGENRVTVAAPNPVPRSPADLLRGLSAGSIAPSSLNSPEQVEVRNHGKLALKRALKKLDAAKKAGRPRVARREQRLLLRHSAIRIFVAYIAIRKARRRSLLHVEIATMPPFDRVWALAQQLARLNTRARAIPNPRPKARGGYRMTYKFDELGIAKQWLTLYALKPFASFHPSKYVLKRGQSAACVELLKAMDCALPGTRFIQFDVKDFFGSISHEWLLEHLPLSPQIVRSVVLLEGYLTIRRIREPARRFDCDGVNEQTGQRGIPQGSAASPVVAEIVMAAVLQSAADALEGLKVFIHSDNIGILVPPHVDIAVLENKLLDAFKKHPAGPFHLTTNGPSSLATPYRFLGYDFVKRAGKKAEAYVPDHVWEAREAAYMGTIANDASIQQLLGVRKSVTGYRAAFKLWEGGRQMEARVINLVDAEISHRIMLGKMPV